MVTQDNLRCARCYMVIADVFSRIMQDLISMHGKTPHEVYELVMNDPTFFKPLNRRELNMVNALRKGTFENLDQSIIYKIFKHFKVVKFVPKPTNGWGKYPSENETNIGDDVERMRIARNRFCHKTSAMTKEGEFDDFFTDFTNMCVRLDRHLTKNPIYGHQQAIKTLKTTTLSTDEAERYLEDRQKVEDLQEELAIMTGQGKVIHIYIGKSIHEIKEKVRTLNAESTTPIKFIFEGVVDNDEDFRKINELKDDINKEQIDIQLESAEKGCLTLKVRIKNKILQKRRSLVQTVVKFIYDITAMHKFIYKDKEEPTLVILPDEGNVDPIPSTGKEEAMESSCNESGKDLLVLNLQVKNKVFQTDSLRQSLGNFLEDAIQISDGRDLIRGNDLRAVVLPRSEESHVMISVHNFLEEIGLQQLQELFEKHEITMDKLLNISVEELQWIGLKDQTHIRIIMNALEKTKEENAVTSNYSLRPGKNENSSDSAEYLSFTSEEEVSDVMPRSIVSKRNNAQVPSTSNHMDKKSDKPEASGTNSGISGSMDRESDKPVASGTTSGVSGSMERKSDRLKASRMSSGVTASEHAANLLEKITNFKTRANQQLIEIYMEICAFAEGRNLFQDLQEEIIIEFGDVKRITQEKIADVLDDSCPIVITGETSGGKSTFINLLLGVDLLPHSALACTSTICRIHDSEEKKIVVTGKSKEPQTLPLEKDLDIESVRKVLKRYVTILEPTESQIGMDKEEVYEFVDIYWPIPFLQENIIIVDTPGIGPDHPHLTKRLFQYLPNALAFIYVINASNDGGVQSDRILKIQEELVRMREEEKTVFDTRRAVFICNKWDLIYEDSQEVFAAIKKTLKSTWSGFQTNKLLRLSAREEMQSAMISDDFRDILFSIESMMPATVDEKIRRHLQWQQHFFDRVLIKLSTRIRNTYRSKEEKQDMVEIIAKLVHKVRRDQSVLKKTLHNMAEETCRKISSEIFNHLHSKQTFSKMFEWTDETLPRGYNIDEIKKQIDARIRDNVSAEIMTKMKSIEIESLSDFVQNLFEWQQLAIGKECGELDRVFQGETDIKFTFAEHKIEAMLSLPERSLTAEEKTVLVVSSPIWIPASFLVGAVGAIIIAPVMAFKIAKNILENKKKVEEYNKNRTKYANEKAQKYINKIPFDSLSTQIEDGILKNIKERIDSYFSDVIPKRIAAGELLIKNIERDIRPPCEIRKQCHRVEKEIMPIYGRLVLAYTDLYEEKVIPIPDVRFSLTGSTDPRHLCQADLRHDGQWIPVRSSTITCEPGDKDKCAELAEINLLRKLRHRNIVALYGFSVVDGGPGKSFHVFTELCDRKLEDEIMCKQLTWRSRQRYLVDALNGIEYLHQTGFVHKNIRLSNILIKGNDAKLSSCGISEEVARGAIEGIPIVRAPEVYLESYCGCESDMFQFGVVIWESWYGKRAFCDEKWTGVTTYDDFIHSIMQGDRPMIVEPFPQLLLVNVMESCWALDPNIRPSAVKVLSDLRKIINLEAPDKD